MHKCQGDNVGVCKRTHNHPIKLSIGFLQWVSYWGFLQKSLNWSWILSSNFLEGGILYGIGGILDHWIYLIICHTHQRSSLDKNRGWIIFLQELWHQLLNSFSLLCFSLTGKKKCIPSHQKGPNYYSGIQKTPPKKERNRHTLNSSKWKVAPNLFDDLGLINLWFKEENMRIRL